jgi:hypothetical protein
MERKDIDCTIYENCIKTQKIQIDLLNQSSFNFIAVGCWGVYCDDGEYVIAKYKKGKIETSNVKRGQGQVAKALINYTREHIITDMFLAGDNIYQLGIRAGSEEDTREFVERKVELVKRLTGVSVDPLENFNIDLQLSRGFLKCFKQAEIDRFFVAIGNHDIENCNVLNKQYNFDGWNMPSLYYNVLYFLEGFKVNIIVLDTNMFEDNPKECSQKPFTKDQIEKQLSWAESVSRKGDWNIVIGHVPYLANGHKKDKHPVVRPILSDLISRMTPQLYICADEHNQQFIKDKTCIVVAGSGGTALDDIIVEPTLPGTMYQNSNFGFVVYNVKRDTLQVSFMSVKNEVLFSHVLRRLPRR